ncbi:MAG: MFS transporter [Armatimonas sp.]
MSLVMAMNKPASDRPPPVSLVALSCLWLPINLFWTVMLQYALPSRVQALVGESAKGEYLGYISLIGAVATTVIQLVVAPLSDACASRWGRRHPFIFWGILLNVIATLAFAQAQNFPLLMVSFFGIQLFLNIANGPYQALLPDTISEERQGIASTYMGMALLLGQLFGALGLLGYSLKFYSLNALLIGILVFMLGATVWTIRGVPDSPAPMEERLPLSRALAPLLDLKIKENPDFFQLLYSRFFVNLSYSTVVAFCSTISRMP